MRLEARIHVLAGAFASQPLAFAHLLDAAARTGLSPDLDHIEVIAPPHLTRLRGFFDPQTAEMLADAARGEVLILVLPGALISGVFEADTRLRDLGPHAGEITRVL